MATREAPPTRLLPCRGAASRRRHRRANLLAFAGGPRRLPTAQWCAAAPAAGRTWRQVCPLAPTPVQPHPRREGWPCSALSRHSPAIAPRSSSGPLALSHRQAPRPIARNRWTPTAFGTPRPSP